MQVRSEPDTWGFERRQVRLRRGLCPRTYIHAMGLVVLVLQWSKLGATFDPRRPTFLTGSISSPPLFAALSPTPLLYHATMNRRNCRQLSWQPTTTTTTTHRHRHRHRHRNDTDLNDTDNINGMEVPCRGEPIHQALSLQVRRHQPAQR